MVLQNVTIFLEFLVYINVTSIFRNYFFSKSNFWYHLNTQIYICWLWNTMHNDQHLQYIPTDSISSMLILLRCSRTVNVLPSLMDVSGSSTMNQEFVYKKSFSSYRI